MAHRGEGVDAVDADLSSAALPGVRPPYPQRRRPLTSPSPFLVLGRSGCEGGRRADWAPTVDWLGFIGARRVPASGDKRVLRDLLVDGAVMNGACGLPSRLGVLGERVVVGMVAR